MPQFLSPICNDQTFDANGDPGTGFLIETYVAGSTTPAATFTNAAGTVANANPITLDSLGYPPSPIWLVGGIAYKFIIKNALGVTLKTIDGISGINDSTVSVSEWVSSGFVPTYISATSFSVPGDQRSILQVGRRIRTTNTAGIVYSGISVSSFGAGVTTVTVINDSGTLDSGLSLVEYGLISATNTSFPFATFSAASTIALTNDGTTNAAHYLTFADGTAGQENLKTDTAKLSYNPSTGALSAASFVGPIVGSGAGLTAGSIPRAALPTLYSLGTAVTASGTAIDITGIPSFANRVTVMFDRISTNGSSQPILRLGNGAIDAASYLGYTARIANAAAVDAGALSTGFTINSAAAGNALHGVLVLQRMTGNTWGCSCTLGGTGNAFLYIVAGQKTLSSAMDRIRLTTVGGTDAFDDGSLNIAWE